MEEAASPFPAIGPGREDRAQVKVLRAAMRRRAARRGAYSYPNRDLSYRVMIQRASMEVTILAGAPLRAAWRGGVEPRWKGKSGPRLTKRFRLQGGPSGSLWAQHLAEAVARRPAGSARRAGARGGRGDVHCHPRYAFVSAHERTSRPQRAHRTGGGGMATFPDPLCAREGVHALGGVRAGCRQARFGLPPVVTELRQVDFGERPRF